MKFLYVYFDFAGYTDIARGTARLFGIELIANFNFPLLRSNLAEFWRSWHISLSNFLRDYVYFPILAKYRNTILPLLVTMIAADSSAGNETTVELISICVATGREFLDFSGELILNISSHGRH